MNMKSSRGRMKDGAANPIDVHAGSRMRLRRELLGLSQEKMAALMGLTFQQIQKYERGINRIGASRLWDISQVLEVKIDFFYEDMPLEIANQSPRCLQVASDILKSQNLKIEQTTDPMSRKESLELIKAYYKINNRKLAKDLLTLMVGISKNSEPTENKETQQK